MWNCSVFMAGGAVRWLSGVTQAQQAAGTSMPTSGKAARSTTALEITQMPVQTP